MDDTTILHNILSDSPSHIYWKDKNGVYLGCNEKQARSLGFKNDKEVIGKTDFELPGDINKAKIFRQNDVKVMHTGQPLITEEAAIFNGKEAILLSQKTPLRNKAREVIGILGISVDITDLKEAQERALKAEARAEAERQIKKAVASFAGTVAHDLRTPLTAINLIGEFLKARLPMIVKAYNYAEHQGQVEEPLNPRQKEGLKTAGETIQERVKVAQNYITFSLKSVKGAAQGERLLSPADLVPCSIEKCVRKVIDDYPFQNDERAKLHFTCIKDFIFLGNEIFMVRVIENLIKNAFEQIQLKGKGEIYIQCN
ncbi:MAG TPA: PAS domain-containing protein, partial [Coxiellaceae bacterium]|nr:PAS domain-containing protein [Coxiellaceae bacterium]